MVLVRQLQEQQVEEFRKVLVERGYSFEDRPNQLFLARNGKTVVNVYQNGKVVVTGPEDAMHESVCQILEKLGAEAVQKATAELPPIDVKGSRIGTDEVGKGDYFGGIVVAGALVDETAEEQLRSIGVKDSKKLSDTSIRNMAIEIRKILGQSNHDEIWVSPLKYNLLYQKLRNVNRILGWAHARAMENLLRNGVVCNQAIADQFGDQSYIQSALMNKGRRLNLLQVHKAERDIAVAAASVLARDVFLRRLDEMEDSYLLRFPKGASHVIDFGKQLVETHGLGVLQNVAKLHFSTTKEITGGLVPRVSGPLGDKIDLEVLPRGSSERELQDARLELFNLISNFEEEMRAFICSKLKAIYGDDWWTKCVDENVRKKCEGRRDSEAKKGRKVELPDCLDFEHYWFILTNNENWNAVFEAYFRDKSKLQARLTILKDVRDPVSHARGTFGSKEKAEVVAAINHLRALMKGQKGLEEFE
jgi:ribonuclease HIII